MVLGYVQVLVGCLLTPSPSLPLTLTLSLSLSYTLVCVAQCYIVKQCVVVPQTRVEIRRLCCYDIYISLCDRDLSNNEVGQITAKTFAGLSSLQKLYVFRDLENPMPYSLFFNR